MRRLPLFLGALAAIILAAGCKPRTLEFKLHGQVVQSDPAKNVIVVKHNDIPGFMPGMTMPYKVKDKSGLNAVQPGDVMDARITVLRDGSDFWLDNIRITNSSAR